MKSTLIRSMQEDKDKAEARRKRGIEKMERDRARGEVVEVGSGSGVEAVEGGGKVVAREVESVDVERGFEK